MTRGPLHSHHVSGRRAPGAPYLDDLLVVALTPAEHRELHLLLADLDAEWPAPGASLLAQRLRRLGITAGWRADSGMPITFEPDAARGLQRLALESADALDGVVG
jgi:hypothetical protein